jgi:hypothetical protein
LSFWELIIAVLGVALFFFDVTIAVLEITLLFFFELTMAF